MQNRRLVGIAVLGCALFASPAFADIEKTNPDTLTLGVGAFDIIKSSQPENTTVDYRIEYRSGYSLLADLTEPYFSLRPFGGIEGTTEGAAYLNGGFMFDIPIGDHFFVGESEAVGFFDSGDGTDMGSFIEFRSQVETGYKFDDQSRISLAFNHISNAGLTKRNHGEESAVAYYSLPVSWLFGQDAEGSDKGDSPAPIPAATTSGR